MPAKPRTTPAPEPAASVKRPIPRLELTAPGVLLLAQAPDHLDRSTDFVARLDGHDRPVWKAIEHAVDVARRVALLEREGADRDTTHRRPYSRRGGR